MRLKFMKIHHLHNYRVAAKETINSRKTISEIRKLCLDDSRHGGDVEVCEHEFRQSNSHLDLEVSRLFQEAKAHENWAHFWISVGRILPS